MTEGSEGFDLEKEIEAKKILCDFNTNINKLRNEWLSADMAVIKMSFKAKAAVIIWDIDSLNSWFLEIRKVISSEEFINLDIEKRKTILDWLHSTWITLKFLVNNSVDESKFYEEELSKLLGTN